eukprot:262960-Chlamydomonas_euryale.AAC.2
MAFELLTDVYKLDASRLYASYFGGDASQGLPADEEARDMWLVRPPPFRARVVACARFGTPWQYARAACSGMMLWRHARHHTS